MKLGILLDRMEELLQLLVQPDVLRQVVLCAAIFIVALIVGPMLRMLYRGIIERLAVVDRLYRLINRVRTMVFLEPLTERAREIISALFRVIEALCTPLVGYIAARAVQALSVRIEWPTHMVDAIHPLFAIWLIYVLLVAIVNVFLRDEKATALRRKLFRPLAWIAVLLQLIGVLDAILDAVLARLGKPLFSVGEARIKLYNILAAFVILYLFFWIGRKARIILRDKVLPAIKFAPIVAHTVSSFTAYAIMTAGVFAAISTLQIKLTTLTVLAGALTVGIGFGLQSVVNNFVSGIILLMEQSIKPGDVVEVNGILGVVHNMRIRSTTVRTYDHVEIVVPNGYFLQNPVTSYTLTERTIRVRIPVGVSYRSDPHVAEEALMDAARRQPLVLKEPAPSVLFTDFGESSLNFELLVWTAEPTGIPRLTSDLRFHIWDALKERGIEIPFPQRDVHIRSGVPWEMLGERTS